MKFNFECDEMDGLVLIDEGYLNEIDDDILYAFDIFLDRYGKSELVYDFPNKNWASVRERESIKLKEFCNSGKMILFLVDKDELNCEIQLSNKNYNTDTFLNVSSGKIILVNAGELIQCLAYPDLEVEKILEIEDIEKGTYAIENEGIRKINCIKSITTKSTFDNVIEL